MQRGDILRPSWLSSELTVLKNVVVALFALVLAACSSRDHVGTPVGVGSLAQEAGVAALSDPVSTAPKGGQANGGVVAVLDTARKAHRTGVHHWQPVVFSEAQALKALAGNRLSIPIPGGAPVIVAYRRHVEHEDGNWTYVGTGPDGADAVITFGRDAVFGSVHTRAGTVRLTTDARGGWVVTTPPGQDENPAPPDSTDVLLPPALAQIAAQAPRLARGHSRALGKEEAATADVSQTVDVVVGYTAGLAQARGGDSAARTRINNLVEVTNQAYTNSGLQAKLRLTHAMRVDYADATSNSDALSKLTGYKSGTGAVSVDPALQPLRNAREEHHGDLVVLLRSFKTPENGGCGIAWLLGGRQTALDQSDAGFGYTVVADGSDFDEVDSKTYFCREETFAHELGHLMGQAHNTEDASTAGAHAYSYGYRQSITGGFYTVMAYRLADAGQFAIRHFANPQVNYNGAPTGVPDAADNARSMSQTMPIVSAFRVAPVAAPPPAPAPAPAPPTRRVVNDLDGDGMSDMVWQGPGNGYFETWRMEGQRLARALGFQLPAGHRVVTAGDFNGDRRLDLMVKSDTNALVYYEGNGIIFSVQPMGREAAAGRRAIGSTDIDGDGNHDLVWVHPDNSYFEVWLMQGAVVKAIRGHTLPADARVATTGDFAADGKADVLAVNAARELTLWSGDGLGFSSQRLSITNPVAPGWVVWGDVDMNADGRSDLLWSTPATSYFEWWNMSGALVQRASGATPPADQRVAGSGDFNGDGLADVLLKGLGNDLHVGVSDGVLFNRTSLNIVAGPGWLPLVAGQP